MFLIFTFMGLFVLSLKKGLTNTYRNKYLAIFLGYLFTSLFVYIFYNIARFQPSPLYMIIPLANIILGGIASLCALSIFEKEDYIRIAKALCISSVLISVFSLLQYFDINPFQATFPGLWEQKSGYRCDNKITAGLDNPNLVGMYLALTLPLFLYFRKNLYWIGFLLSCITIYLSRSNFAIACGIFSIIVWVFLKFREFKWIRLGIMGSGLVTLIVLSYYGIIQHCMKLTTLMSGRLDCWRQAIELWKNNPLFGLGLGFFSTKHIIIQNAVGRSVWYEVHNDYLQYLIELGFIGMFLFVLLIVNAIRNYSYKEDMGNSFFAMFLTFLLFMAGSFPFEVPTIALLGLTSWFAIEKL